MRPDAEKDGAKWASKNDDRVTRIGHFIRKYRIDELPQLLNVFRGEMAFIGPRPERPQFVEQLVREVPYYNQRHNVKPGLAGWAQLNYPYGASVEDSMEKLKFELSKIVTAFNSDRIGLVIFTSEAFLQSPLTYDHNMLLNLSVGTLSTEQVGNKGTDFAPPLKMALEKHLTEKLHTLQKCEGAVSFSKQTVQLVFVQFVYLF